MLSTLSLLALAIAAPGLAKNTQTNTTVYTFTYTLNDTFANETFFSGFNFVDEANPAGSGFASYVNESVALREGFITNGTNGGIRIGVDTSTKISSKSTIGRRAVRLNSKIVYTNGLFVADFSHVPGGICGVWPAYWMSGPTWPIGGEFDIVEGVNTNTYNKITGYTNSSGVCTISGAEMTNTITSTNCTDLDDTGCSTLSTLASSYGAGFNTGDGGVYAVEWQPTTGIKAWFFPRSSIPSDISSSSPAPDTWGTPAAYIPASTCDMATHFYSMQLVLNTNFCGGWAERTWNSSGCGAKTSSCEAWVRENPSAFEDAFWEVNYIKTFVGSNVSHVVVNSTATSAAMRGLTPPVLFSWVAWVVQWLR